MKTTFQTSCVVLAGLVLAASNLNAADADSNARYNSQMSANQPVCTSKIIGKSVKNDQNQTIGEVKDLILANHSGAIRYAIISTGGAVGLGAKHIAVPFSSLQFPSEGNITLSATKDELKAASTSPQGAWASVQGQAWTKNVDGYFGQPMAMNSRFERESAQGAGQDQESVRSAADDPDKAAPRTVNLVNSPGTQNDSSDMALQNQIQQKLAESYTQDQLNSVRITVANGTATLTGSVADDADRQKIETQAKSVAGVTQVDNQLTVRSH